MVTNIGLPIFFRLVAEFPATGGVLTSSHIYSVKLLRYVTYYGYFLASCEIVFSLFIITFIIQEAIKMVELKKEYFRSAWNWLELLLLGVSYPLTFTSVLASLGWRWIDSQRATTAQVWLESVTQCPTLRQPHSPPWFSTLKLFSSFAANFLRFHILSTHYPSCLF